jgi:hypothetical protein
MVHQPRTLPVHTYKKAMNLESAFPIKHILDTPILPLPNLQCLLKPFNSWSRGGTGSRNKK